MDPAKCTWASQKGKMEEANEMKKMQDHQSKEIERQQKGSKRALEKGGCFQSHPGDGGTHTEGKKAPETKQENHSNQPNTFSPKKNGF